MTERRLTTAEVCERLKVGRSTLWRRIKAGTFPKSRERGRWREADVEQAMAGEVNDAGDSAWSADPDAIADAKAALARERKAKAARRNPARPVRGQTQQAPRLAADNPAPHNRETHR